MSVAPVTERLWPAKRLTALGVTWLQERFPGALIVPEFVCGTGGEARIDLAAITREGIYGVEVKGEGDTHARLATQGPAFSAVCSNTWLLPAPTLPKMAERLPYGWSILEAADDGSLRDVGYTLHKDWSVAPKRLLSVLWRGELMKLTTRFRVGVSKRARVMDIIAEVAELVPLREIRNGVCDMLLKRDWKTMSGNPRRLIQPVMPHSAPASADVRADGGE